MEQGRHWTLLGISEPGRPDRIVIWDTADVTFGRAPENDVLVDDSDASRHHAIFRRTAEGHQVEDQNTSNGTFVNGERLIEARALANKDVVKLCAMSIRFIETRKDPNASGLEVSYASELKGFSGGSAPNADPSATTLGLVDQAAGPFVVGAVNDFTDPNAAAQAPPRDLDMEDLQFGPGGPSDVAGASIASGAVSVHLEIEGLSTDLARTLESLFGKVIELPELRIRIKPDDGL